MDGFPFLDLSDWYSKHESEQVESEYQEYLHGVSYHLSRAESAAQSCREALRAFDWAEAVCREGPCVRVVNFQPEAIAHAGDEAIREAIAALDTGLVLTSYVLQADVEKHRVRWNDDMRRALAEVDGSEEVVETLEGVFSSIGYNLAKNYRNWVTHRGAPRVLIDDALAEPIMIPDEVLELEDERGRRFQMDTHLLVAIPRWVRVECKPFVPPVQMRFSAEIGRAPADLKLPGFEISEGSSVSIEDAKFAQGSLMDSAEEYRKQNPVLLEESSAEVAGEKLTIYSATDYQQSVSRLVRFAHRALREDWDSALAGYRDAQMEA